MQLHAGAHTAAVFGSWKPSMTLARAWRTLAAYWTSYRPEKHYMRGPGPKWHAKHAQVQAATAH